MTSNKTHNKQKPKNLKIGLLKFKKFFKLKNFVFFNQFSSLAQIPDQIKLVK